MSNEFLNYFFICEFTGKSDEGLNFDLNFDLNLEGNLINLALYGML